MRARPLLTSLRRSSTALLFAALLATLVPVLAPPAEAAPSTPAFGAAIDRYAPYQGQTFCDPAEKPGVVAFRALVQSAYSGVNSGGISRPCDVGGKSEHKEGRAWDWMLRADVPADAAKARDVLTWLLEADSAGNGAARARRLGVMYIIWDRQWWSSWAPEKGWQPYTGASPHTDHIHFSFSWDGALRRTSWWNGGVPSTGPVPTGPVPQLSPDASPFGSVDSITADSGGVRFRGWAIDPGTADPVDVHVYVGATGRAARADLPRGDVAVVHPAYGAEHGYDVSVPAPPGTHTACAYAINVGVGQNRQLGCRTVTVLEDASPVGSLDSATGVAGGVRLSGWTLDPGTTEPIEVRLSVGTTTRVVRADGRRADVAAVHPAHGPDHGFSVVVPAPAGTHTACAHGLDVGAGDDTLLGCRTVTVLPDAPPIGSLDSAVAVAGGVRLTGWALDPGTVEPIDVHVYVGQVGRAARADGHRPDVARVYPVYGAAHGYEAQVPVGAGTWSACAYGIDAAGGQNSLLGCRTVTVLPDAAPFGSLDGVSPEPGGVRLSGWAIDPGTSDAIDVHVYVGSTGRATRADRTRADVGAVYPLYGPAHGFDAFVPVPAGTYTACAYGIDVSIGARSNTQLGCRTVTVLPDASPFGSLDGVAAVSGGVHVSGWAIDPGTARPIEVHVYVGTIGKALLADARRDDVGAAYPLYGAGHGYSGVVSAPPGSYQVCAYGIDVGSGDNTLLGCRAVTVGA